MAVLNKYAAKDRLLLDMKALAEKLDKSGGYSDQLNRNYLYDCIDSMSKLNRIQAARVESAILEHNAENVEAAAKYGWKPQSVSPLNYIAFVPESLRG